MNSSNGDTINTERGMMGEGWSIAAPIITISAPLATALEIRMRSGRLANTHMPRYSPKIRNISPYITTTHTSALMPPCQKSSGTEPLKRSAYAASHATATATRSKPNAAIESNEGLIRIVIVTLSEDELPPTAVDLPANQGQNNVPRPEQ